MKRVLERMLDESEFLSPTGARGFAGLLGAPLRLRSRRVPLRSEICRRRRSDTDVFGGNSNWRGPVWMPINYLIIESLRKFGCLLW